MQNYKTLCSVVTLFLPRATLKFVLSLLGPAAVLQLKILAQAAAYCKQAYSPIGHRHDKVELIFVFIGAKKIWCAVNLAHHVAYVTS